MESTFPILSILAILSAADPGAAALSPVSDRPYLQEVADRWEGPDPPPGAPASFSLPPREVTDGDGGKEKVPVLPVLGAVESGGDLWCATARGIARRLAAREPGGPAWRWYAGRRWLPDGPVTGLAADGSPGIWVRTAGGYAHIRFREMTLARKAEEFEARLRVRHLRHGLVAPCRLLRPGDLTASRTRSDDNDGLWTAIYAAAASFRSAVTGSEEARRAAAEAYGALEMLQAVAGIPGYPARSVVEPGEPTGEGGEWHPSADGRWRWKGDTSSDELVGHFFAANIFAERAADPSRLPAIRRSVAAILDHIIGHGYFLVDLDGKPTTWGVWAPRKLNGDPAWWAEKGLNALEILSFLAVGEAVSGEARFRAAARDLIDRHGYAENTVGQRIVEPPGEVNFSDDQLAFLSYYGLLERERDPALRRTYLRSLERSFRAVAAEANPLWTSIAAASGVEEAGAAPRGRDARERAVRTLRDTPMELVDWRMENSFRRDLARAPHRNRFGQAVAAAPLHPAERGALKYNADPYVLDAGGGGGEEDDGAFFLLAYWMGRFHGLIAAP